MKRLLPILLLAAYGCAHKPAPVPLPPLPHKAVFGAGEVPTMAIAYKEPPRASLKETALQLAWTNPASHYATNYGTVVEESLDLIQWHELSRLPYLESGFLAVTNPAPSAYYRICNIIKP